MPLRDHFRSPVNDKHTWGSLHGLWPATIVRELFDLFPPGFQAEPNINLGSPFENDIAPTHTGEADLSEQDVYEVRIYDVDRGRRLVAAIEIVSPSNKDRPETREVFVAKVAALLQKGVCVSIVDLVTIRQFNLYADFLTLLGRNDPHLAPTPPDIYTVTLRSRQLRKMPSLLDAWFYPMTVGQLLPTLPIWLSPDLRVSLNLEMSYEESCRLLRIR
jgi:Protein of unknown function (DUF4058)